MSALGGSRDRGAGLDGSARWLALPRSGAGWLALVLGALAGCGEGEPLTWVGEQDCAVGIPPEGAPPRGGIASVQLPLSGALITPLGSGFSIRNFTLGPIGAASGAFRCEALQVTARFVAAQGSGAPLGALTAPAPGAAAAPVEAAGPGRPIEVLPFECRAADGRSYWLDGQGQASRDALFFNQTFTAWLGAERATLVCSTRFQLQASGAADAGVLPELAPFGPAPEEPIDPAPEEPIDPVPEEPTFE